MTTSHLMHITNTIVWTCVCQAAGEPEIMQVGSVTDTPDAGFLFMYGDNVTELQAWPGKWV